MPSFIAVSDTGKINVSGAGKVKLIPILTAYWNPNGASTDSNDITNYTANQDGTGRYSSGSLADYHIRFDGTSGTANNHFHLTANLSVQALFLEEYPSATVRYTGDIECKGYTLELTKVKGVSHIVGETNTPFVASDVESSTSCLKVTGVGHTIYIGVSLTGLYPCLDFQVSCTISISPALAEATTWVNINNQKNSVMVLGVNAVLTLGNRVYLYFGGVVGNPTFTAGTGSSIVKSGAYGAIYWIAGTGSPKGSALPDTVDLSSCFINVNSISGTTMELDVPAGFACNGMALHQFSTENLTVNFLGDFTDTYRVDFQAGETVGASGRMTVNLTDGSTFETELLRSNVETSGTGKITLNQNNATIISNGDVDLDDNDISSFIWDLGGGLVEIYGDVFIDEVTSLTHGGGTFKFSGTSTSDINSNNASLELPNIVNNKRSASALVSLEDPTTFASYSETALAVANNSPVDLNNLVHTCKGNFLVTTAMYREWGATLYVEGNFDIDGANLDPVSEFLLRVTGTNTAHDGDVKYTNCAGYTALNATDNCTDGGNNTNVNFV